MRSGLNRIARVGLLLLAACAQPAPPLPPVSMTPEAAPGLNVAQRAERCEILPHEISAIRDEMAAIRAVILGRRGQDQIAASLAAILFPPMLSQIDQQKVRKQALDARQAEVDKRLAEQKALACPSTT